MSFTCADEAEKSCGSSPGPITVALRASAHATTRSSTEPSCVVVATATGVPEAAPDPASAESPAACVPEESPLVPPHAARLRVSAVRAPVRAGRRRRRSMGRPRSCREDV